MNTPNHPRGIALQAFADGEMRGDEATQVHEHCATCAECRGELERIRALQGMLARDAGDMRPRPAWPTVAARLQRERRPLGLSFAFGTALACAAGLALAIIVGGGGAGLHDQIEGPALEIPGDGGGSLLDIFASAIPEES